MKYRKDYQLSHDIDWFCRYNNLPLHIASNGSVIPDFVDSSTNRKIQRILGEKQILSSDIEINKDVKKYLQNEDGYENYISSFVDFARLGFISVDTITSEKNNEYLIVAYPKNGKYYDAKEEIPEILDDVFLEKIKEELKKMNLVK